MVDALCEPLENRRLYSASLVGTFADSLPQVLAPAMTDHAALHLTNTGDTVAAGKATVSLYASTDQTVNAEADLLATMTKPVLLRPRQTTAIALRFPSPENLPSGNYFLVANVDAPASSDGSFVETIVASPKTVSIPEPFVDLTAQISAQPIVPLIVGESRPAEGGATVLVVNQGNAPARGPFDITMYASTDNAFDSGDTQIAAAHFSQVNIRAGGSRSFPLRLTVAANTPVGRYTLFASINSADTIAESNLANDIAIARKPLILAAPPTVGDQRRQHHDQDDNNGSDDIEVDVTDNGSDMPGNSDVTDPPFADQDATPPTASTDGSDNGSDFYGDFSGDIGGGADF